MAEVDQEEFTAHVEKLRNIGYESADNFIASIEEGYRSEANEDFMWMTIYRNIGDQPFNLVRAMLATALFRLSRKPRPDEETKQDCGCAPDDCGMLPNCRAGLTNGQPGQP